MRAFSLSTRSVPDETPFEHLRNVLFELGAQGAGHRLLVLTHQSPDPDALGALVGVRFLFTRGLGREAEVATLGRIHRAENLAMLRELDLDFADYRTLDRTPFDAAVLVDSQPGFGHTVVPEDVPLVAVFDHHEPLPEGESDAASLHSDVRPRLGATSSLVYEYIRDAGLELDTHTATSLFCGVRFDTGDLSHGATALDEEAYYATLQRADKRRLARIQRPPLSSQYYKELSRSLGLARRYGSLVLALLGEVPNPEWIAEMADFVLRMDECQWALVGGAFEGRYYVSVRTDHDFRPAYPILETVLSDLGSFGGHGRVAGGQTELEDGSADTLQRHERTLRSRALRLLEERDGEDDDACKGVPLT